MGFGGGSLRKGELVAGGGAVLLFVALFFLPWFAPGGTSGSLGSRSGVSTSADGWHSLTNSRWILLITIAVSVGLVISAATQRSPAVPSTLSMISCVLGAVSSLLVLYRVIDHPFAAAGVAPVLAKPGIYCGLIAAVVIAYGGYLSLHAEGGSDVDQISVETMLQARTGRASTGPAGPGSVGRSAPSSAERTGRRIGP